MRRSWLALLVVVAGCNQVFGLDPPAAGDGDGGGDDADGDGGGDLDADPGDGGDVDAPCGANSNTHDEDEDGIVDACDLCPHIFDPEQANGDGDGAGDACDPRPAFAGERIALFLPFDVLPPELTFDPPNTGQWAITGDELRQVVPTGNQLARYPVGFGAVSVSTFYAVETFVTPTSGQTRSAGVWARISSTPSGTVGTPYGLLLETVLSQTGMALEHFIQLAALEENAPPTVSRSTPPGFTFATGQKYAARIDAVTAPILGTASTTGAAGQVGIPSTTLAGGDVGLRTHDASATFYYLVVISRDDQ